MATIQLDTVYGDKPGSTETIDDVIALVTKGTDISAEVVNPHGPGGGWPIVEFTGPAEQLYSMIDSHYGLDKAEVDETYGELVD